MTWVRKYDSTEIRIHYLDDMLHGIISVFDREKRLLEENLFIKDVKIASKRISYPNIGDTIVSYDLTRGGKSSFDIIKDSMLVYTYYNRKDTLSNSLTFVGSLILNEKMEVIGKTNSSAIILMPDTVNNGISLKGSFIGYFGNMTDTHLEVFVDNIQSPSDVGRDVVFYKTKKGILKFEFETIDGNKGYNFIVFRVRLYRDSVLLNHCILFDDYYVVAEKDKE